MNDKQLKRVMENLAGGLAPSSLDLWPAIRLRFEASNRQSFKGGLSMHATFAHNWRWRLAGAFLLALGVVAVLVFATPQGRALAQTFLQFFRRAETDHLPLQSWQLTPIPTPTGPDPASILDANLTVNEAEQQAGFDVLEPAWMPDNLTFVGATLESNHSIVRIFYRYVETNGLVLREEPFQRTEDCQLCGLVGASAAVETVQIGDSPGEYAEGVWKLTDKGPVWEPDPYMKTLRWQAKTMAFELLYMGPPDSFSKEDMLAIARSLK